jgi:hypothetical protein
MLRVATLARRQASGHACRTLYHMPILRGSESKVRVCVARKALFVCVCVCGRVVLPSVALVCLCL